MRIHGNTTFYSVIVDVMATAAAFFGMSVHQMSVWPTASNHRCVEYDWTPSSRFIDLSCSFLMCLASQIYRSILLLSLVATPGGLLFWGKQQRLPKCQQQTNWWSL